MSLKARIDKAERDVGMADTPECQCAPGTIVFGKHGSDAEFVVNGGGAKVPVVADGEICPRCGKVRRVTTKIVGGVDLDEV